MILAGVMLLALSGLFISGCSRKQEEQISSAVTTSVSETEVYTSGDAELEAAKERITDIWLDTAESYDRALAACIWALSYTADMDCSDWNSLALARAAAIIGLSELNSLQSEQVLLSDADLQKLLAAGIDVSYQQVQLELRTVTAEEMRDTLQSLVVFLEGNAFFPGSLSLHKEWASLQVEYYDLETKFDAVTTNYLFLTLWGDGKGQEMWGKYSERCPAIASLSATWDNEEKTLEESAETLTSQSTSVLHDINVNIEEYDISTATNEELIRSANGDATEINWPEFTNSPVFVPRPSWYDTEYFSYNLIKQDQNQSHIMLFGEEPKAGEYSVLIVCDNVSDEEFYGYIDNLQGFGAEVTILDDGVYNITYGTTSFAMSASEGQYSMYFYGGTDVALAPFAYVKAVLSRGTDSSAPAESSSSRESGLTGSEYVGVWAGSDENMSMIAIREDNTLLYCELGSDDRDRVEGISGSWSCSEDGSLVLHIVTDAEYILTGKREEEYCTLTCVNGQKWEDELFLLTTMTEEELYYAILYNLARFEE